MFKKIFSFYKSVPLWLRIILIVVLVGIGGYLAYSNTLGKKNGFEIIKVKKMAIVDLIELSGEVTAYRQANLHFAAGGLLTYLPVKEGDVVKKWQTIASLDQRQLRKDLQKYLNLYSGQRNDFDQIKEDDQNDLALDTNDEIKRLLANNQYTLDNTVIDVESKDLAVKLSRLYAPFEGIITRMDVKSPNVNVLVTDIFQIVDPNSLYFEANLDEEDINKVSVNQKAIVLLDAYPDESYETSVKSIAFASKETTTGTAYEVRFDFPEEIIRQLRLSLNGTVEIILDEKENVLTLPFEAVDERDEGDFIMVMENDKPIEREVKIGIQTDTEIEILSGLSESDQVIISKAK